MRSSSHRDAARRVFDRRLCGAVCPVACVLYLALGQLALGRGACYGRAAIDATSEDTEVAATVPCALFGAVVAQSVVQCAVARARPAKGRVAEAAAWPCAGVQALTLLYYVVERSDAACLLTAPPFLSDVSGVTARPLHLVLWTCSVSAQVLAIYSVERELSARMRGRSQTRGGTAAPRSSRCVVCWCSALLDARAPGATSSASRSRRCRARRSTRSSRSRARAAARGAGGAARGDAHRRAARARGGLLHRRLARLPWSGAPVCRRGGRRACAWSRPLRAKFLPASIRACPAVDP